MKLVIDARWIFPEISGVGLHTLELVRHLLPLLQNHELLLPFNHETVRRRTIDDLGLDACPNVQTERLPCSVFSLRSQLLLPGWLKQHNARIFHSTNYMLPLAPFPRNRTGAIGCITTIHDMIPMVYPQHAPKSRKARLFPLYCWIMRQVAARSDNIITVSEASRRDIISHLHIPESESGKIRVIANGVSERFTPPSSKRPVAGPRRLLYVGRFDPYKNVCGLVRSLALANERCDFPIQLIIAGSPDPRYPEAQQLAKKLGVDPAIIWTGYVDAEKLVELYQQADILVHPSRYEGFGLQIVEAMACGLPVISSNAASLPEVGGDAAILLDPNDTEGFADQIHKVLTDDELAASLREKGLRRAARFTWKRAAEKTLALYEELDAKLS